MFSVSKNKGRIMLKISRPNENPIFSFVSGYREDIDRKIPGGAHKNSTCFSKLNRYPEQVAFIKELMEQRKKKPLRVLDIGVAQGQEPLTHIKSAFDLAQRTGRRISSFLNLKTVDILKTPPPLSYEATSLPIEVLAFLAKIYRSNSGRSFWGIPIEKVTEELLKKGRKFDVVLFNNVIQHMSPQNEPILPSFFEKLTELVSSKGNLCFSCEKKVILGPSPIPNKRVQEMMNVLKSKNFVKIAKGIFTRRR